MSKAVWQGPALAGTLGRGPARHINNPASAGQASDKYMEARCDGNIAG